MKYITTEQLENFQNDRTLKGLCTDSGVYDETILEGVNVVVVSIIDGRLKGHYTLPLSKPIDPLITTICGDLMKYRLYARRNNKIPEGVVSAYNDANRLLKEVGNGDISLDVADGEGETAPANIDKYRYSTPTQKFGSHFTGFDDL